MGRQYRFPSLLFLIGLLFLFQQCTGEEQQETGTKAVLQAVEELRIGKLEGEDEYIFGAINYVAVGEDGKIFVADHRVPVIRMYDKEGTFVRNVGREGRGPGEYQGISGMQTFPDGRLSVWDVSSQRISVYNPDGKFVESHTVNSSVFGSSKILFEIDHSGNFYVIISLRRARDMPNPHSGWVKVSPEGIVVDTLKEPLDTEERPLSFVLFTGLGDAYPFTEKPTTTLSPQGYLITGRNDEYSFSLLFPDSTKKQIKRNFDPVEIKSDEKKQWEAWVNYYDVKNTLKDIKPAYKDIFTDSQGRIWIYRYTEAEYTELNVGPHFGPESRWWEPPTFDLFLPDGSFYSTVILPFNVEFQDAKDDIVWGIVKGEYDEQYVARFRLEEMEDEPDFDS